MTDTTPAGIQSVLNEKRLFPPPAQFTSSGPNAEPVTPHITSLEQYIELHARSIDDPETFWAKAASELHWFKPWSRVLEWRAPDAEWFVGATTNLSYNCLDRQIDAGIGDQTALIWEGEPIDDEPDIRTFTYRQLRDEVCRCANALRALGVSKGDIVTLYMPMIPELAIAMLACARLGAPHSIIFGGFSASAIADRVHDAKSKIIITADGGWRRGKIIPLKDNVDQACKQVDTIDHVVVVEHCANTIAWHDEPSPEHGGKRDHWWRTLMAVADDYCPCEEMDAEDLLFVLYTSGTTGKPKGIMHTTGGYMVYAYLTSKYVFDLHPGANQVFWCTADIGWVTGHSYIIYGILPNRVPTLMYEGAPNHPAPDRFWDIVQRHHVTHFYTAPTAIRAFMKWGDEHPKSHDLSSLRVLGTVGEPINPEAWMWYHRIIGNEQRPIVDTWWQTETGGQMITPLPGAIPTKPGSCALPFFGVDAAIVDATGVEQPDNAGGLLAIRKPWPGMLRGILGDRDRYVQTYWSTLKNKAGEPIYFAGDGARRDQDGYFWIMGRVDDVINVAGHRLGTMEIESALVSHESVVEAAVVPKPDELKGTGIAAFVTLGPGFAPDDTLKATLRKHVCNEIGAIAKPDMIRFTDALPKTRSGKIMRRLLRDIAAGIEEIGDTTTIEDYAVLAKLRENEES